MSSVRAWLEDLGLPQYADVFEVNDIDVSLLADLNDQVLKDIGVASAGHRLRLLGAIRAHAKVEKPATGQAPSAAASVAARSEQPSPATEGERRQLTVMFCDLVGSTALTQALDPELLRELMRAYQQACRAVIEKYDGHVAQYLGDGLMVYFGWPKAHEDDADRAVRASLEIVEAVKVVSAPSPLQVRVGIATGAVVVGETGGGDASIPKVAVGETPNLAARLQGLAGADQIVIGSSTRRLLGEAFELVDLGAHALKGINEPANAYRVAATKSVEGRFEATRAISLTPFVGREEEVALLKRRWEQARDGEGQVVLLSGEAGIGKSRIFHELRSHIGTDANLRLRYQCSPYHRNSAFHPIIEHLERSAEFTREDSISDRLNKLEQFLKRSGYSNELAVALLASLLSVPADGRYAPLTFSPQRQKDETIKVLLAFIQALSAQQPLLILFEDLHWIDPSSLEALDLLIQRLAGQKVLLLVTYRPEFESRWSAQSHVTLFSLNRLGKKQISAMVSKVTGNKSLPAPVVDHILAKTDGVPLFVEELTRAILESDLVRETETHYELTRPLASLSIPSTLQDSLMARLDRLPTAKEVAQIGACIGRDFGHDLVAAASSFDGPQLVHAIEELIKSGLISRTGSAPYTAYIFKHALVQDVAYQSMLKTSRAKVHALLAKAILDRQPGIQETTPEVIAHHYTQAGLVEKALPFWLSAGQKALARTALPEAVGHLSKALELVHTLPPSTGRDRSELDIRINLAIAQMAFGGWTYAEIPKTLTPAGDLANRLADTRNEMISLFYIWLYHFCVPNVAEALDSANKLHTLGDTSSDRSVVLVAEMVLSATSCAAGDWEIAKCHGDKVLALYDFDRDSPLTFLLNHDVRGFVLGWGTNYYSALGFPQKAREASLTYIESAPRIGHSFNLLWALTGGTEGLIHTGNAKRALQCNREARSLARENAMAFAEQGPCNYMGGLALIADGQFAEGYEMVTRAVAFWNSAGGTVKDPMANNLRAYALGMLGRTDEGIALAQETLRYTHKTNHRTWEPVTYRVLGDLLVNAHREGDGRLEEAESAYNEALRISRAKSAKGFELIAATGLAQLWKVQGKAKEAYNLLAPIYNWFTEGFDTKDLKEAKALLEELQR